MSIGGEVVCQEERTKSLCHFKPLQSANFPDPALKTPAIISVFRPSLRSQVPWCVRPLLLCTVKFAYPISASSDVLI